MPGVEKGHIRPKGTHWVCNPPESTLTATCMMTPARAVQWPSIFCANIPLPCGDHRSTEFCWTKKLIFKWVSSISCVEIPCSRCGKRIYSLATNEFIASGQSKRGRKTAAPFTCRASSSRSSQCSRSIRSASPREFVGWHGMFPAGQHRSDATSGPPTDAEHRF